MVKVFKKESSSLQDFHKQWRCTSVGATCECASTLEWNRSAPFAGNRVGHEGVASRLQGCAPGPQSVELPYSCFREEDNRGTELNQYKCLVADYEISVGVTGTGFWRAPEILPGLGCHTGYFY